mmetsp:Transcript_5737/g.8370  ORF Transcript_5737/g.8370 Transcript_5737/m.8370 type:complete len:102 (+) Transcript_5737:216-521(+)
MNTVTTPLIRPATFTGTRSQHDVEAEIDAINTKINTLLNDSNADGSIVSSVIVSATRESGPGEVTRNGTNKSKNSTTMEATIMLLYIPLTRTSTRFFNDDP